MIIKAMTYLIASEARKNLYKLIDEVAISHNPTLIKGKRNTAVLLSFDDWQDLQETLLVSANEELSQSIIKGLNTPFEQCSAKLD
jgi:antitoxin YefM